MRRVSVVGTRSIPAIAKRWFLEDQSDVFAYRNREASQVRRENPGVRLGSSAVERKALREAQQRLVDEDKMVNWKFMSTVFTAIIVFYSILEWTVSSGAPFEPTEYTPYVKPIS